MKVYTGMEQAISNCLNRLTHEVLGCAPAIILIIFLLQSENIPTARRVMPKNYSRFYSRMKEYTVN